MTEQTKDYENVIINLIESTYNNKLYTENELSNIINLIKENVLQHHNIEEQKIIFSMMKYLHYSSKENSFYFNSKRAQIEQKEYHKKILKNIQPNIFIDTSINNEKQIPINDIQNDDVQIIKQIPINVIQNDDIQIIKQTTKNTKRKQVINVVDESIKKEIININETKIMKIKNHPLNIYEGMIYNPNSLTNNPIGESLNTYVFPLENFPSFTKKNQHEFEPFGTQYIHDEQIDDPINNFTIENSLKFDKLRAIIVPPQKSPEWHAARHKAITASDVSQALGNSKYDAQYMFVLKKTTTVPFGGAANMHHGTKHEDTASMIYAYRMNVDTDEFGLMPHSEYSFLAASPDAICTRFKHDKKHNSQYIGMMVEIKCTVTRKIFTYNDVVEELGTTDISYETLVEKIVPKNYFEQMQLQLETCNLEHCHFWQCKITEYNSRQEFIDDTDPNEPFRSKDTKFEKGCIIQLLRKDKMFDILNGNYTDVVISSSKYIYPFKVEMSPYDCDVWVQQQLDEIKNNPDYDEYFFDKVVYWKLVKASCFLVYRDREWFKNSLPKLEKVWSYVTFLRDHPDTLQIFCDFVETRKPKINKTIMNTIDKLCNNTDPNYETYIDELKKDINSKKVKKIPLEKENPLYIETTFSDYSFVDDNSQKTNNDFSDYMFIDDAVSEPIKKTITKPITKTKVDSTSSDYMFIDEPVAKPLKKIITKTKVESVSSDYMFIDDTVSEPTITKKIINKTKEDNVITKPPIKKIRQVKSVIKKDAVVSKPIKNTDIDPTYLFI